MRTISLVALAHGLSHFFQISTAVLFPLIKDDLGVSYVALGGTVSLYYVVSGVCQTAAGFAVDRYGARRVLFLGLALTAGGALVAGLAHSYAMLVAAAIVGGLGNSVFHPCDFSILNARVRKERCLLPTAFCLLPSASCPLTSRCPMVPAGFRNNPSPASENTRRQSGSYFLEPRSGNFA